MLSLGLRARYFNPRRFQGTVRGKILKHYTVLRSVPAATVLRVPRAVSVTLRLSVFLGGKWRLRSKVWRPLIPWDCQNKALLRRSFLFLCRPLDRFPNTAVVSSTRRRTIHGGGLCPHKKSTPLLPPHQKHSCFALFCTTTYTVSRRSLGVRRWVSLAGSVDGFRNNSSLRSHSEEILRRQGVRPKG